MKRLATLGTVLASLSCDMSDHDKDPSAETSEPVDSDDSAEPVEGCPDPGVIARGYLSDDARAIISSTTAGSGFGEAVALVGDLSGDGVGELAVGAPGSSDSLSKAGEIYLFLGPLEVGETSSAEADGVLLGVEAEQLGATVAGGYDLDGDGLMELIWGAPGGDQAGVVLSSISGMEGGELQADVRFEETSGTVGLGTYAEGVGDLDGDGVSDLALGAPSDGVGGSQAGAVYIVYGPLLAGAYTLEEADAVLVGEEGDGAGVVSRAGDLNSDGLDDLAVGAPEADGASGQAWVVDGGLSPGYARLDEVAGVVLAPPPYSSYFRFGQAVSAVDDFDGAGADDLAVGASDERDGEIRAVVLVFLDGATEGPYEIVQQNDGSGIELTLSSGDLDGDGVGDLLLGGPRASVSSEWTGAGVATAIYGGEGGEGINLLWPAAGAASGSDVDGTNDVSGDGVADMAVGVPGAANGVVVVASGCW